LIVPEESRSQWLDLLRELGYRFFMVRPLSRSSKGRNQRARRLI
jgi:hypothetical protein